MRMEKVKPAVCTASICDRMTKREDALFGTNLVMSSMAAMSIAAGADAETIMQYGSWQFKEYPKMEGAKITESFLLPNTSHLLCLVSPLIFFLASYPRHNPYEVIYDVVEKEQTHPVAVISATIYVLFGINILKGLNKHKAIQEAISDTFAHYKSSEYAKYAEEFKKPLRVDLKRKHSKGNIKDALFEILVYVLYNYSLRDTLDEAAKSSNRYVATCTGFFSGMIYDIEEIPLEIYDEVSQKEKNNFAYITRCFERLLILEDLRVAIERIKKDDTSILKSLCEKEPINRREAK